jgi:hypothetical protein
LLGCSDKCGVIDIHNHPSPDGKLVATVYGYTCYTTTGNDKYVDLHSANQQMRHPGNLLHVGLEGVISVTWLSSTQLAVSYCEAEGPTPTTTNIDGVTITFKEKPGLKGTPSE